VGFCGSDDSNGRRNECKEMKCSDSNCISKCKTMNVVPQPSKRDVYAGIPGCTGMCLICGGPTFKHDNHYGCDSPFIEFKQKFLNSCD